jgi:hypothetical protein
MSIQYNLAANAGQASEPVSIISNTKVIAENGYIQWAPNTLADYKNNVVVWRNWPTGTLPGNAIALNSMIIRLVGTSNGATATVDQGNKGTATYGATSSSSYWSVGDGGNALVTYDADGYPSILNSSGNVALPLNNPFKDIRLAITGVGDSLMANGNGPTSGTTVSGPTSQSHMAWALYLNGYPTPQIINRGVGSKTIDLVITEQLPNAMADDTDVLWIHVGINNLNPSIDPTLPTVSEIISRMDYLVSLASSKVLVILDAISPLAQGSISGAYARRADIPLINAGYKAIAAKYKNVIYNDVFTPIAQDATTGLAISGVTVADGIHWNSNGGYILGASSGRTINSAGISFRSKYKNGGFFQLPQITGNGGTKSAGSGAINGDIATGYTATIVTNSSGVTINASVADGKQRMEITNNNAAASVIRFQYTASTSYLTGLAGGDVVMFSGTYDVIKSSGLMRTDVSFTQNPGGSPTVTFSALQKSGQEATPVFTTNPYRIKATAIGTLTATPTGAVVIFSIEVASGGTVTLDMSNMLQEEATAF